MTVSIKEGKYPSPPACDLYFITKGKPKNPAVLHFLKWILTTGQKYIDEAGYIKLSDNKLKTEQKKLKQDRLIKK
jgi:phosphate transport system substrate-binding protein